MVREYILTKRERHILERFLETGEKLNGFSVLIHYLKKGQTQISEDIALINKALEKKA